MTGLYMENLSDLDLVDNIKNDIETDKSLAELIDRHSGIYLDIVNSYMRYCPFPSLREDIINDKAISIYNSALRYKKDKGAKFSTFLGNETKWKCLNISNKNKKNFCLTEIDENKTPDVKEKSFSFQEGFALEEEILSNFKDELKKYPDSRVNQIFDLRYSGSNKLTPWRKISEEMNLSIQGCINIHNSALKKISKTIKSKYEITS